MPTIDFELPIHIIYHYYISGTVAIILNVFVSYLILFHKGKIDSFSYYLLAFQISCILSDVNVTFLMQPIGLFPICAGYSNGVMSTVFNWSSNTLMTILVFFLSTQIQVISVCFLRKHKAIVELGAGKQVENTGYLCLILFIFLFPFALSFTLFASNETREVQLTTLYEIHPEFAPKFEQLREFQYYVMNPWMQVFFVLTMLSVFKTGIIITICVGQIFRILQNTQQRLSRKTVTKHKVALRGLLAQFLTTPVAFLPACIVALTVLLPTENSQKISWYSITVMTTHSTLNSLVVMLTYPEFRKTVLFWKKTAKNKSLMHGCHFFTLPVYLATLIFLYREPSKAFRTYKYYIIVHILINIFSELYVSHFMLPDTNLPFKTLRTTGLMAQWGFSGLIQFYLLAQFITWTGGSIIEMFYYRFKVCVLQFENRCFSKFLKFQVNFYRFTMCLHPLIVAVTFNTSLGEVDEARMKLWTSEPNVQPEVTCYSVMLTVYDSYIFWFAISYYMVQISNCALGSFETLLYISNFIRKSVVISKATERLQKMLILSLFIQTTVHGLMILSPTLVVMYAIFFDLTMDDFARFMLVVFANHGFFSTCAMILFTKPLRDKMLPCIRMFRPAATTPIVQASTTVENSNR